MREAGNATRRATYLKGFPILQAMFRADTTHQRFQPHDCYGGFIVTDQAVYEEVWVEMGQEAERLRLEGKTDLLLVECGWSNYRGMLAHFSQAIRDEAYVFYLKVPPDLCCQRMAARLANGDDERERAPEYLALCCTEEILPGPKLIARERIRTIANTRSKEQFERRLARLLPLLL